MDWIALIPTIIQAAGTIKNLIDIAQSNADLVTKVREAVPTLAAALEEYGTRFFPNAKKELAIAAAVTAAYDPNVTKWLQGGMNALLDPSPGLVVDGIYGPKTKAAVETLQAKLGLPVDGWAGQLTQSALSAGLAKLSAPVVQLPPAASATPA